MKRKPCSKKKLLPAGAALLILAAAVFFSTPWLGKAAPEYIPMPGIQLKLETEPSHFMDTLSVTIHNVEGRENQEYFPGLRLEYCDHGKWRQLKCLRPGVTALYTAFIPLGESKTLYIDVTQYGRFLRSGHYRAVIENMADWKMEILEAVSVEFDI